MLEGMRCGCTSWPSARGWLGDAKVDHLVGAGPEMYATARSSESCKPDNQAHPPRCRRQAATAREGGNLCSWREHGATAEPGGRLTCRCHRWCRSAGGGGSSCTGRLAGRSPAGWRGVMVPRYFSASSST